jgi:asparagine synthase (glutamine-hydrolysing)
MESGFVVSLRDRSLQFEVLGEHACANKSLISTAVSGKISAIAMGRIYYRAGLEQLIGRRQGSLTSLSEAELAVQLYAHLGAQCFQSLEGDFALVIWDCEKRLLFALRDPIGGFPLFFARSNGQLQLSTSLRTLKQTCPSAMLNVDYLAEYLSMPTPFEQEMPREMTIYTGISRILPGRVTTFELADATISQVNLCDWTRLETLREQLDFDEIVERYRHLLTAAVHERMRGRVGTHYSGGMDSTSVGLIANMKLGTGPDPLRTYTLTYDNLPGQRQEGAYIEAARKAAPAAIHTSLPGDDWYDFEDFENDIYQDEPCGTVWQSTMSIRTVKRAADDGVDTLFSGFGGEEFIALSPYYIADLIKRGRFSKALSESLRLARARNRSRWHYLWNGASTVMAPWLLLPGMGYRSQRSRVPWPQQTELTLAPWIREEFARKHRLIRKAYRNKAQMASGGPTPTLSMLQFALRYRPGDTLRWTLGTSLGVFTAHPYMDVRLVRFCLSVFEQLPPILDRQKPLLGEAMAGVLPDLIRLRRDKGHFDEAAFRGLARNVGVVEKVIADSGVEDLGIFDCESLLECVRQSAAGVKPLGAKSLYLSLYLTKWLALEKVAGGQALARRPVYSATFDTANA